MSDHAVALKGAHKRLNAALVGQTLVAAGLNLRPECVAEGLKSVIWPARFQHTAVGNREFILDGAHNPEAARRLAETWREEYGERKPGVILGIVRDKDAGGICAELAAVARSFTVVPVRSPRGGPAEGLAEIAGQWRPCRVCQSLEEAIATATPGETPTLITGSLFLMGEALVALGLAEGEREISAQ